MTIKQIRSSARKNELDERFDNLLGEMRHLSETQLAKVLLTLMASKSRLKPQQRLVLAAYEGRKLLV